MNRKKDYEINFKNIKTSLKNLHSYYIKKLRTRNFPITFNEKIINIKKIYLYSINSDFLEELLRIKFQNSNEKPKRDYKIKPKIGFENIIINAKLKKNIISSEPIYILGKIIARSSSDLLSIIAQKLKIKYKPTYKNYKFIQYPLHKNDSSKKLIIIKFIFEKISMDEYKQTIGDLEAFFIEFQQRLSSIGDIFIK
ncbi:MAG: hypothetical protein ACTSRZ_13345 [Promethearchaeota archaeon]